MLVMTTRDDELTAISGWTDDEIAADGVRAATALYMAATLEELALIGVVEHLNELNQEKMLSIGAGHASNLLHTFWDQGYKRTPAPRRLATFTRVLGTPAGEDSNDAFPGLLANLASAIAEGSEDTAAAAGALRENVAEHIDEAATKVAIEMRTTYADIREVLSDMELRTAYRPAEDMWEVVARIGEEFGGGLDVQRPRATATTGAAILRRVPELAAGEAPGAELTAAAQEWLEAGTGPTG
jgi:hypothetical protein